MQAFLEEDHCVIDFSQHTLKRKGTLTRFKNPAPTPKILSCLEHGGECETSALPMHTAADQIVLFVRERIVMIQAI